jgi:2-amino-4-hydroxy-6-hydroxymethyldihydropteridine diphosphokinase
MTKATTSPNDAGEGATAFVGLGANLGDAPATLRAALIELHPLALPGSLRASSMWRSAPVDASGPDFYNVVARFEAMLAPHALLDALQAIERRFGRQRPYRNAPRTLDLDLLLYAGLVQADERLELPHPRAAQRAFVLAPLAELWPDGEIPGAGRIDDLLARARLDPTQRVELFEA